jgi:L-ascorbate metabolism protein UlaG (beta-lactamase superfamily)
MCIHEVLESVRLSRRSLFGVGAAAGVTAATAGLVSDAQYGEMLEAAQPGPGGGPGGAEVNFRWLGTNSWEISFGEKTILFDPWPTRFDSGAFSGRFDLKTPLSVDEEVIDRYITKADAILVGHGHFDHIADIPYIAKKTGARVIGSETHSNLLRAYGVPENQIITAEGGEFMQFDGYAIEVIHGLHGFDANKKYIVPTHLITVPPMPQTVEDLPEGDTLIYHIRIADRYSIVAMSTGNYIERNLTGLRPDVLIAGATGGITQVYKYTERLLGVLGNPRLILPTHWDNFEAPITMPQTPGPGVQLLMTDAQRVSPPSEIRVLNLLDSYAP